jgi:hypothetical protein
MNWDEENVARVMGDYKRNVHGTLDDLKATVEGITGIPVSRMTLSRRLRGISTQKSSGGRPRKALVEIDSNSGVQVSVFENVFCFLLITAAYSYAFCFGCLSHAAFKRIIICN